MRIKAKEVHLWLDTTENCYTTYDETKTAFDYGEKIINTTIPSFLSWFYGERLFVHRGYVTKEIILGKDARISQNVEKMLMSGRFGFYME